MAGNVDEGRHVWHVVIAVARVVAYLLHREVTSHGLTYLPRDVCRARGRGARGRIRLRASMRGSADLRPFARLPRQPWANQWVEDFH